MASTTKKWWDNAQWEMLREVLIRSDKWKHYWTVEPRSAGGEFALVAGETAQGITIFQVFPDVGVFIYTDSAPGKMNELKQWLIKGDDQPKGAVKE